MLECNNDVEQAVNFIIDRNGDNVWTEQKNRKTKKADTDEPKPRGDSGFRGGRRGGSGRGVSSSNRGDTENIRPRSEKPAGERSEGARTRGAEGARGRGGRGRGGARVFHNRESGNLLEKPAERTEENTVQTTDAEKPPITNGFHGKASFAEKVSGGKKSYPQKFDNPLPGQQSSTVQGESTEVKSKVEQSAASTQGAPAPAPPKVPPNRAGPLSFAALVASGGKKPPPPAQKTPTAPLNVQSSPATSTAKEATPTPDTPKTVSGSQDAHGPSADSKATDTVQSLTSQLKNDLGLGAAPGEQNPQLISSGSSPGKVNPKSHIPVEIAGAEEGEGAGYRFGPAGSQQIKPDESTFASSNNSAGHDYSRPHEVSSPCQSSCEVVAFQTDLYKPDSTQKPASINVPPQQMNNFMQQNMQSMQGNVPRRTLGYAETNSVSINPPENRQNAVRESPASTASTMQNFNKPPVTAQSSLTHQQQIGVHHQQNQQQLYNPMFNNFPYMNLYSPVAGRDDQNPYANPYLPYHAYGMDMNSIAQVIPHLPIQHQLGHQNTHRNDHLQGGFNDKVQGYGQTNAGAGNNVNQSGQREPAGNVPPPPGFSGPPASMGHHNMFPQFSVCARPCPLSCSRFCSRSC